jgi:hypothetical protein
MRTWERGINKPISSKNRNFSLLTSYNKNESKLDNLKTENEITK